MENVLKIVSMLLEIKGRLGVWACGQDGEQLEELISQCEDAIDQLEEADHTCRKYMLAAAQFKAKAEAYQQMVELLASNLATLASPVYQNACRCNCNSNDTITIKEGAYDE